MELWQRYIEYLDSLDPSKLDFGVTVDIDGKKVRFDDDGQMSATVAEWMK